jgi:hypothetical protein
MVTVEIDIEKAGPLQSDPVLLSGGLLVVVTRSRRRYCGTALPRL